MKTVSPGARRLWALFRPIDWAVEDLVGRIDAQMPGSGIKLTKVILLGLPLMGLVLVLGYLALQGDGEPEVSRSPRKPLQHRSPAEKMV